MVNKITWVNFLHIYQPPWQNEGVIDQISSESYEYLITLFEKYPNFRTSLNITGNLVEQLDNYRPDLIKRLQALVSKGHIELTSSSNTTLFCLCFLNQRYKGRLSLIKKFWRNILI